MVITSRNLFQIMMPRVNTAGFSSGTLRNQVNGVSCPHAGGLQENVVVRPYCETDRAAIRQICCNTGFFGKPIDSFFKDRDLFADLFTRPYLDHEPDWAFIAEAGGRVVGYLLGSVSRNSDLVLMRYGLPVASRMLLRWARGCYADHPRSARFVRWLLTVGYCEQPRHPKFAAHLHFDLENTFRGRGVGRRLWQTFEERLMQIGINQCYGAFFSHPQRRPELAYARYGFKVFDRRRTTLFEPEIPGVEVVCVHKEVTEGKN